MCNYRRSLDLWVDLLTTYTHDSEVRVITAPLLISTVHKSTQHPLSIFQPTVSSPAVPWQRFLTVEIIQLHSLRSSLHRLSCRTQLNSLNQSQSQIHIATVGQSVSKSWCRVPSGAHDQIFITVLTVTVLFFVGRPLWREDGSVFCTCCWPLPAQCTQ
jgi:hypothetical protein